MSVKLNN